VVKGPLKLTCAINKYEEGRTIIIIACILASLLVACFAALIHAILSKEAQKHETQKWIHKFEMEEERNEDLRCQFHQHCMSSFYKIKYILHLYDLTCKFSINGARQKAAHEMLLNLTVEYK